MPQTHRQFLPIPDARRPGPTVRILDLSFIMKDADGGVSHFELDALDPTEASVFDDIEGEVGGLFSEEDLDLIGEELAPNSSAAVLLWEDTWAAGIIGAIHRAGGELLAHERIPPTRWSGPTRTPPDTLYGIRKGR